MAGLALFAGSIAPAVATDFGLDSRPANLTCLAPDRPPTTLDVTAQRVFEDLPLDGTKPISMQQPPGDPSRWFLASRLGGIYSFANVDTVNTLQNVVDLTDRMQFTSPGDSQQDGIVGIALHPQFPASPYLFVGYNAKPSPADTIFSYVSRFTSTDGGQTFDEATETSVLTFEQLPGAAHHLDGLKFGPDGYLYISLGDGGNSAFSQDLTDIRGSVLRLDIDQGMPYTIPSDNPLVGTGNSEEIYAWGLRNPWRFTFDSVTGDLWLGDVGANTWEEINLVNSGDNFGWRIMEGNFCDASNPQCDMTGLELPVLAIEHPDANAIIGGYVYRGSEIPALYGTYVFGDSTKSEVRAMFFEQGQTTWETIATTPFPISSFAEGLDGEVYFLRHGWARIHKLVQTPTSESGGAFPGLLSETGCFDPLDPTKPASGLIPFTVNTALWSDGADKLRWMALPDGTTIDITPDGDFDFPIGTVLIKNFSFDAVPVETRLFVRHDDGGWAGYSYDWNDQLTDAVLLPGGKVEQVTPEITWTFPDRNQCLQCHTNVAGFSIGPEILQLNGKFLYPSTQVEANQLATLDHIGMFSTALPDQPSNLPALVPLAAGSAPVERKARSYLHANCSGCHQPGGPPPSAADFRFSNQIEEMNVCNAAPSNGDLGVPGATLLSPGNPANSIISLRLHALDGNRMPPLGTAVVDTDGTGVIDAWISQTDVCDIYADTDGDSVRDNVDNCQITANPDQADNDMDGSGDVCDDDDDNDTVLDGTDNCPLVANVDQSDNDLDSIGDACDADDDNDTVDDTADNCPLTANLDQADNDVDGVGNVCDNCLETANPTQCDTNADGYGNHCDADLDNNNIINTFDLQLMRENFGLSGGNDADLDCNDTVNSADVAIMRTTFGTPPGPSGTTP